MGFAGEANVKFLRRFRRPGKSGDAFSLADTSQLVARVQAGDTMAFDALVTEYRDRLFRLVRHLLRDPEDASEAVQEVFVRAYEELYAYDARRPFFSWLAGIAQKCCLELRRQSECRPTPWTSLAHRAEEPDEGDEGGELLEDDFVDPQPGPEREWEGKETHDLVLDLVHRLPTRDRLVVILRCANEYSCDQVADLLSMTPEQVSHRLYVSRRWLERQLKGVLESRVWLK